MHRTTVGPVPFVARTLALLRLSLCALTILLGSLVCTAAPAPAQRPNIVLIFTDDHSLQTIGAYNARLSAFCRKQGVTPNIDQHERSRGNFSEREVVAKMVDIIRIMTRSGS